VVPSGWLRGLEREAPLTRRVEASSFPVRTVYTLTGSGFEIVE